MGMGDGRRETGDGAGDGYGCGRLYGSGTLEYVCFVKREKKKKK